MKRKIVQIAVNAAKSAAPVGSDAEWDSVETVYALCDDGTVWWYDMLHGQPSWKLLPDIPQEKK